MLQNGFIRAAVSSNFKILCIKFSSFMSRFWCLPVTGLRFCAHTGGVQEQEGCGGSGIVRFWDGIVWFWDGILQCSWISWISPAPLAIFNKLCEILDWIGYMRYMLIYYRRINRVERYIWRKYILTAVIDSATQ